MVMSDVQKQLRIKTGVCKRLRKDITYYEKEKAQQEQKIAKMVDEGKCEYDVKKQREVLDETISMLPETKGRLENGFDDLKAFIDSSQVDSNDELKETELYQQAQDIIKEVATFLGHETEEAKGDDEEEY